LADEIPVFTVEQARALWQDYLRRMQQGATTGGKGPRPTGTQPSIAVVLDEALDAATNELIGATSVLATRCDWSVTLARYVKAADDVAKVRVWNHMTAISYESEEFGYGVWQDGHWHFTKQGGGSFVSRGIVNESHGKGYYTVELAGWGGRTPRCFESVTSITDEEQDCDPCQQMVGFSTNSLDDNCGDITLPEFNAQHVELVTKAYVLAYDPASTLVPLRVGSDCLLVDLGDSNPVNDSNGMSGSSMEEEPVYQIIRGHQTHTVQYVDTYGCCGTGEDVLISRKAIIFAAVECDVAICNPCSDGGGPS
jgi:hypothetical protein